MNKYIKVAKNNPSLLFWLFLHTLRSAFSLDYRWSRSGYSLFPQQVTLIVTKLCNFGCEKCSSKSPQITKAVKEDPSYREKHRELSTQEWKALIDQLKRFYHPSIYFCGGEPTLRPDLFELVRYVKKQGMLAAMTTNGSLLNDDRIEELCQSGLDFISFSIDGPPEYHNRYRCSPRAFEKAVTAIKKIVAYKRQHKLSRPSVKIATVLDAEAPDNGYYVLDLARSLKIDEVAFGNLMFYTPKLEKAQKKLKEKLKYMGEYMIGLEVDDDFIFKKARADLVSKFRREAPGKYPELGVILNPPRLDPESFFDPTQYPCLSSCKSTFTTATISPDGYLYHCQEYFIGNVREKSFRELWNDSKLRAFRMIKKKIQMPACFRCLEGQEIRFSKQ